MSSPATFKRITILQAAARLGIGESSKETSCPQCGGGTSREKCFSITRTPVAVLYHCYRASCGLKGAYKNTNIPVTSLTKPHEGGEYRPFTEPTLPLPEGYYKLLTERYGLTGGEIQRNQIVWGPSLQRVLYPILGPYGARLGMVGRTYAANEHPKSLIYWEQGNLRFHIPDQSPDPKKEKVFLVEDQVSSMRVARFEPTVALLGTHLDKRSAVWLSRKFREVVVLFDIGADMSAYKLVREYGSMFRKMKVVPRLPFDPKDMTDDDLKEVIKKC